MDHNPYESPAPIPDQPRPRRRMPWMLAGLLVGFGVMALLLPAVSDSNGTIQTVIIFICLIGGPLVGLFIDFSSR